MSAGARALKQLLLGRFKLRPSDNVQGLRTGPYPAASRLTSLRDYLFVPRPHLPIGPVSPERPKAAQAEARCYAALLASLEPDLPLTLRSSLHSG